MTEKILKATHQGEIKLGDISIPCAVLEDGTRVLRERSVAKSLGKKGSGAHWQKKRLAEKGALLPEYISAKNLDQFIDDETRVSLLNPVIYKTKTGGTAQGIPAQLLTEICNIWLEARGKGALYEAQEKTAKQAEILLRGFAKIGIVALVDEVTGYQYFRDKDELNKILEVYIAKELLPWAKRFPDEFYKELFRLRGWQYSPITIKKPQYVGKLTNYLVYEKLPPGVLDELRNKNPKNEKGNRKFRHHQFLTDDIGNSHLEKHLASVTTLMRVSSNWRKFEGLFKRAFPDGPEQTEMEFMEDDEK